jgi:hypothetical protein
MALPFTGAYAARYAQTYSGNLVWGTGANPVHMYYGSPAARLQPTRPLEGRPQPAGAVAEVSQPWEAIPDNVIPANIWGYQPEDDMRTYVYYDDRPSWDVPPEDNPSRISAYNQPSWSAPGKVNNQFRATRSGAHRLFRGKDPRPDYMVPTETVSEGWKNKPKGQPADAKPSDPSQYEMQTSMEQRYRSRNNRASVVRGTDEMRTDIPSRVVGQRLKVYSGQLRHYDMFPQQQSSWYERPFFNRTAGTGQPEWMMANEQWEVNAVERTPPPDPYIGQADAGPANDYGYTGEDYFYA